MFQILHFELTKINQYYSNCVDNNKYIKASIVGIANIMTCWTYGVQLRRRWP